MSKKIMELTTEIRNLRQQLHQEKERSKVLVDAYESYIKVLVKEIDGLVGLATAHGWKSCLWEAGQQAREKINAMK